jgi:hypothetical protein
MMKWIKLVETDKFQVEICECDCGYHFGIDATFLDQVGDFTFKCPSCNKEINTSVLFPQRDETPDEFNHCPRCGYVGNDDK